MKKEFVITSTNNIVEVAEEFINYFKDNRLFAFKGKMGAGKTTFIKALCEVLKVKDTVCSPTFAIVNVYLTENEEEIYHFDFYRLNSPSQAFDIGIEEYFYSGNYCFMEWAENIEELVPEDCLWVEIEEMEDKSRRLRIEY
jgi:tRNA threonylcarbamoyladenosine biosynthesis protein TsaE